MPFTADEIESIRADCFANDVPSDLPGLENCTEEALIEYFESGGTALPEGVERRRRERTTKVAAPAGKGSSRVKAAEASTVPGRRGCVKGVLCLHAAASSGNTMLRQLRPLGLEAALGVEMHSVDGLLTVDPALHKDAKMLKAFYPAFPNLEYMQLYETHQRTMVERLVTLAAPNPDDRPLNLPNLHDLPLHMQGIGGMGPRDDSPWLPNYHGIEPALSNLARAMVQSPVGAANTALIAAGQGANLLTMLLALVQAAGDGTAVARQRRERLWPPCGLALRPCYYLFLFAVPHTPARIMHCRTRLLTTQVCRALLTDCGLDGPAFGRRGLCRALPCCHRRRPRPGGCTATRTHSRGGGKAGR